MFNPNEAPTLDQQIRARGQKFVENHDSEAIDEAIEKVENLEGRESAVTADVLKSISGKDY